MWGDLARGFQQCFYESMNSRVISVDGGGKARINHTALADLDINHLSQSIIDCQCRIGQAGEQITAGRAHDGGAYICWAFGLIGGTSEIKKYLVAFFLDPHMKSNRLVEFDAVAV